MKVASQLHWFIYWFYTCVIFYWVIYRICRWICVYLWRNICWEFCLYLYICDLNYLVFVAHSFECCAKSRCKHSSGLRVISTVVERCCWSWHWNKRRGCWVWICIGRQWKQYWAKRQRVGEHDVYFSQRRAATAVYPAAIHSPGINPKSVVHSRSVLLQFYDQGCHFSGNLYKSGN